MRKIKRVLAVISAVATLAVSAMPVSAGGYIYSSGRLEFNNPKYDEYVSMLGSNYFPFEEKIIEMYNREVDNLPDIGKNYYRHLYLGSNTLDLHYGEGYWFTTLTAEKEWFKSGDRFFTLVRMTWEKLATYDGSDAGTEEEISDYLKESGFRVESLVKTDNGIKITYPKDISTDEIVNIVSALEEKYGYVPQIDYELQSMNSFRNLPKTAEPTLKGDVNLDEVVDLADLTTIAKYNLSNESYPLENETAYANADMNNDGVVDNVDLSILIENQLGK